MSLIFLSALGPDPTATPTPRMSTPSLMRLAEAAFAFVGLFGSPSVMSRTSFVESARAPPDADLKLARASSKQSSGEVPPDLLFFFGAARATS